MEFLGEVVANNNIPFRSIGSGNTVTYQIQYANETAVTDATVVGVAAFDSAAFDVDANGFVTLLGGGVAATNIDVDASTPPGTDPVVPNGSGNIVFTGAQVASGVVGANVLRSNSLAANSVTYEIQRSADAGAPDSTLNGVAHFDSASFSVDSDGFVSFIGSSGGITWNDVSGAFSPVDQNGYFITGTATGTLPASPSQGETIKFVVDHATEDLTIDAPGTQLIRNGTGVSSAGGTATSNAQGDSLTLVYRASTDTWIATEAIGTWTLA